MTLDEVISYNRLFADMETKSGDLEVAEYYRDTAKCLEELKELREQIAEYKRLLKAAVEDFRWLESHTEDEKGHCCISGDNNELACIHCPLNQRNKDTIMCGWNYEAEALALIGEEGEQNE